MAKEKTRLRAISSHTCFAGCFVLFARAHARILRARERLPLFFSEFAKMLKRCYSLVFTGLFPFQGVSAFQGMWQNRSTTRD